MDTVTGDPNGSALFRLSHQGVAVAVRLAMEPDDPAVVHDTVDDRGGHVAVSEHLSPPSELQVRGEHHAPFLVGIRDDLEQEPGPVDVDGQVAQLVDDQQPGTAYRAQFRVEPVVVPRAPQPHHQRRRGEEPHRHAPLARQHAGGDRHVRWIGNGVLDNSLEDESLFGEFLRAPVSEGGVEPLVVEPPHIVVEIAPQLLDRGVVVPVYELLLQQAVGGFDHRVVVRVALARQ